MRKNILSYLEETAERLPDKLAFSNGKEGLSFSELQRASAAVGSFLINRGACREPVVIFMDKHPNTLCAFFGAIYAGCFYVCLDEKMPEARMRSILDSLKPRFLICDAKNARKAEALGVENTFAYTEAAESGIDREGLLTVRQGQCDTDPIYVVFTSGSTGMPKGVIACHRSVIDYTESICTAIGFSEDTVFGNQTPLYFDAPLKEIMPTLKLGGTTYFIPKMNFSFPVRLIEYLNEYKINTVCWVASAFVQVSYLGALESNVPKYLTTVCFGSEVFPRKQYNLWREALPCARFFNLYGPTEATGMSCYWEALRPLDTEEPIPIGRPFDNTDILLITEEGGRAAFGQEGEICIRGTCLTLGYYKNPEKTAEVFVQNPLNDAYPEFIYRTGDIGRYNSYGELCFVCRKDNQIKHMGHRIELGEIEAAALKCEGVGRAACVYDREGKRIALFYVGECEEKLLLSAMVGLVPRYMVPSVIKKITAIPLTDNGKTDRKGLTEMAKNI